MAQRSGWGGQRKDRAVCGQNGLLSMINGRLRPLRAALSAWRLRQAATCLHDPVGANTEARVTVRHENSISWIRKGIANACVRTWGRVGEKNGFKAGN